MFTMKHNTIVMKCKIRECNLNCIHFSNILIDIVTFELELCTMLGAICYKCNILSDIPENGL